ncbi:hypothetical protein [Pyxidicoccus sp. MSG2]|uniref:hypothetical protein n=1 Tax=Pyxidicoccus sp. MSG2 TaxID=2996790 RepID=UPI002270A151|nr:hypothetical protein [Pyxidicoccus sp. MSG2]MCY1015481.1 hypothetical protein [Pyxidicoccus sp. MSG2]
MDHMPYESMEVGGEEPGRGNQRQAPSEEEPKRTPRTAEGGGMDEERRMPQEEPGKTPGSSEGEDPDRTARK